MEKRIRFDSDGLKIEGLLYRAESTKAAVITHPHPLYGGDMNNPVVAGIAGAYQEKGFTTLRFNFRGTGGSQGCHNKGIGEQNDVRGAIDTLRSAGVEKIDLAGYSFGAWVNAHLSCSGLKIDRMVMVSPPIGLLEFKDIESIGCLALVVTGSRDDIAPVVPIQNALTVWNPLADFEIIDGADHFYSGHMADLSAILENSL
jgi:alpha/beta superfamily hydrolase